jgi:hypothetical protein
MKMLNVLGWCLKDEGVSPAGSMLELWDCWHFEDFLIKIFTVCRQFLLPSNAGFLKERQITIWTWINAKKATFKTVACNKQSFISLHTGPIHNFCS